MENPGNPLIQTTPHSSIIVNCRSSTYGEYILNNIPPGYQFQPTGEQLVRHYLKRKVYKEQLAPNKIHTTNVYGFNPQDIPARFEETEKNEWYFFTRPKKWNSAGTRLDRKTPSGHWKSIGRGKPITYEGKKIGYQNTLDYNEGDNKTNWGMHEYGLSAYPSVSKECSAAGNDTPTLSDEVLCRIFKKKEKKKKKKKKKKYDRSLNNSAIGEVGEDNGRGENQNPAAVAVTSEDHEQSVDRVASCMNQEYNVNENQDDNLGHHMMNSEFINPFSGGIMQGEFPVTSSDFDAMLGPLYSPPEMFY